MRACVRVYKISECSVFNLNYLLKPRFNNGNTVRPYLSAHVCFLDEFVETVRELNALGSW